MPEYYGITWSEDTTPMAVEMAFIQAGGYSVQGGKRFGKGLFHHYRRLQQLLWPEGEDHHRWSDLMLSTILSNRITAILGARDSGKAQPLDSIVYTPHGPKRMGDLSVGSLVCSPDGSIATVQAIFPQGTKEIVEVCFTDGSSTQCSLDHLWLFGDSRRKGQLEITDTFSISQSLNHAKSQGNNLFVPRSKPALFFERPLPMPAYLLGVLLGDGGFSNSNITLSSTDEDILSRVKSFLIPPYRLKHHSRCDYYISKPREAGVAHQPNPYKDALRKMGLWGMYSEGKFVPKEYLYNSIENRLELVRGLMDTDGTAETNAGRNAAKFYTISKQLADDFVFLIESLGGICRVSTKNPKFTYKGEKKYGQLCYVCTIEIDEPQSLFYLERKASKLKSRVRSRGKRIIKCIKPIGLKECQCIKISNPNGLYLTDRFIVTHNTHIIARFALTDYFAFPNDTLSLMSSTDLRGLQLRVWGDVKDQYNRAKELHPWLPGHVVESQHGIFTDEITEDTPVRDMRRGIICIPCLDRKGSWVGGLEKFVGIKQKRRRVLGDEVQFMHREYLTILSNLDKGDFKGVFVGNPLPNGKALDAISEPVEGWPAHVEPKKTEVYPNKYGGVTVDLVGIDSPNYDVTADKPVPYTYLIDRQDEKSVGDRYGRNSEQYYSQILGVRKEGLFAHRVLTREMCEQCGAFNKCVWDGAEEPVKVYALDAGYGGDRAVAGWGEFGREVGGQMVVRVNPPQVIQLSFGSDPEDQIALYVKRDCDGNGIPGSNMFFDAGMRATMATALSKMFSPDVNAINFGGSPSKRPVSNDEYVTDRESGMRRLKRCDEHYIKFVTELWFSVRLAVLSRQMRELPSEVAEEFYMREWTKEKGDRYEIETKEETKKRMGISPDLADWLVIMIEGARRLGFMIENAPEYAGQTSRGDDYLEKELRDYNRHRRNRTLHYV